MSVPSENVIELSELRIGNLLSYKGNIVHVTLLDRDIDDEYQEIIGFCPYGENTGEKGDWNRALAADLARIPLTEDWITKCGFERNEEENCNGYLAYSPDTAHFSVKLFINGQRHVCLHYLGMAISTNHPQYLHELQNLYFTLTGEELKTKAI